MGSKGDGDAVVLYSLVATEGGIKQISTFTEAVYKKHELRQKDTHAHTHTCRSTFHHLVYQLSTFFLLVLNSAKGKMDKCAKTSLQSDEIISCFLYTSFSLISSL